jgi:hypothetical protein
MISARVAIFAAAAALLGSASADAACTPNQTRDCVINLSAVPQISQQVVASDRAPAAKAATTEAPYTGPTVGLTPTPRKFPTLGYRWSFD